MVRASLLSGLSVLALAACSTPETGGLETAYTSPAETTDSESEAPSETDTETETETGDTDGEIIDPLRFVATGSGDSVIIEINLDDPANVPEPVTVATVMGTGALFGPTGTGGGEVVLHDRLVDQLRVSLEGEVVLSPITSQEVDWISSVWFGDAGPTGHDALISASPDPLLGPETLLWATYDDDGELLDSFDITPPNAPGTMVSILARSPDSRWAAAAVSTPTPGFWDLFLLYIDDNPGQSYHIDYLDLTGIPAMSVPGFLALSIDDERVVYRKETLPDLLRPVAVAFENPDASPVALIPNLPHTFAITPADTTSRLLVSVDGDDGYHELRLIELDGPTSALEPIVLTEPNTLALSNATERGHGFDALGRIFYVYGQTSQAPITSVGISLVSVVDSVISERVEIANIPAGAQIEDVRFDADLQLLGYRVQTGNTSAIHYIDLTAAEPAPIRVDQSFEHSDAAPLDAASFGWAADRSTIAVVGLQQGQAALHVAQIGDATGATLAIALPDVEATPGLTLEHRPQLSPAGDQLMLWFGTLAGNRGLIHARTDGAAAAEIVLAAKHPLTSGTYLPH